jgi:hypothetical protein
VSMEPCRGSGPGLHHRLCQSDAVSVEIESVSRDHCVNDDDGRNLSTAFARMGLSEDGTTETFVLVALHYSPTQNATAPSLNAKSSLSQRKPAPNAPWSAVADDDGDHILGELHGLLQPVITVSYIKDLVWI